MEKELVKFAGIGHELLKNPSESSVRTFSEYMTRELNSGHIAQLSQCFKNITDALDNLEETENSNLEELFNLDFHLIFLKVLDTLVDHDVVCTPDAVETLLSFFDFLSTICEKSWSGKAKLVLIVPVLICGIIVNEERGIRLRVEAVRLTNMILGDVVNDKVDPTDSVSLAFKELEDNMEHLLVTAGDFELQAGMVELIFRLIPCAVRHERAQEYFSTNSASQAFSDITSPEFEAGCRNFLNTINQSQKEKQSVVSIPCYSASFGTTEVHQPRDEKIQEFWVDFNFGSKSISLFVEEKDQEGNYKEGSSWETVVIKAERVEDHRLKETNNNEVALLLKLKHAASDLVNFVPPDTSQYVKLSFNENYTCQYLTSVSEKILGSPHNQNTGGDSDVSSTPSTKASVAINPVHIKSRTTEMSFVMPTASVMSQAAKNLSGNEMETIDACKNSMRVPDQPAMKGEDERQDSDSKECNAEVETKGKPVKRASKRLQSKVQSKQDPRKSRCPKDHEMSQSDSSEKSLPSAFNVDSRLTASKEKSVTKPLSNAGTSRKAIREKVFSKVHSRSLVEIQEKPKGNNTKFHMVTPARRREPRSGGVPGNRTKVDNDENKEESFDIVQDSLPLAESMEDENEPNHQDNTATNEGFGPKKRKVVKKKAQGPKAKPSARQRKTVQTTKSGGFKSGTTRKASQSTKTKQPQLRAPLHDGNEPDIYNESGSICKKPDESVLEGPKRGTTNRRTSQSERARQQQVRAPIDEDNESDISNDGGADIQNSQDEPFLEGPKRGTTNRKTSQSERAKQQVRAPIDEDNEPHISNDEGGDIQSSQDEPFLEVYEGSGYLTECYVQEASPFLETSTPAVSKVRSQSPLIEDSFPLPYNGSDSPSMGYLRARRPVSKEYSRIKDNLDISRKKTSRVHQHESGYGARIAHSHVLDTANITQTPKSGEESIEDSESTDSEEEKAQASPLKRSKSIQTVKTSRNIFQHSEASDADEQDEEKEDTGDEFESVHSDVEMHYDYDFHNINTTIKYNNITPISREHRQDGRLTGKYMQHGPNTGGSNMKYPVSRNDSGIGETPFVEEIKKQTKASKKRSWKQKPLQVSVTKTPITPRSEQMDQDEDISVDVESDGESVLSQDSEKQTMDKRQRRKRKFVGWSRSGPSNFCGSSRSDKHGTRPELTEEWYKEPVHVSEARMQSCRGQHIGKPKKLSYEDKSTPYNQQEPEEGISDEEEIRREVQGLINVAGSEIVQAVRRKRHMIRSFFQRTNETMLSTMDSFWDDTQTASYNALEKYKSQFTEQVQVLGKQMDKTSLIVGGMEETFNTVAKQLKILKSQRQVEEKRFDGLQHIQGLMETEVTKLERRRNEQEATLRTELEKEMLKLQNKFLQDTRKQKEDYLKMTLNTLRIP